MNSLSGANISEQEGSRIGVKLVRGGSKRNGNSRL